MEKVFALKGNILHSTKEKTIDCRENSWLVCENGKTAGIFKELPGKYAGAEKRDCGNALIVPGLVDLHLHAPQYAFRGLGMDMELIEWLNTNTFPEESKYKDLEYARVAYGQFAADIKKGGTTRAAVFATVHVPATLMLMDMLEQAGISAFVGKVNMDRNAPETLCEESAEASLAATKSWLSECAQKGYKKVKPMLTPRFVPSCTDELMQGLGRLQKEHGLAVQSHLSENLSEIEWVKELCPGAETYADAYLQHGLFGGGGCPTIMAHCVYSEGEEMRQIAENGVYVAHCPLSNTGLSSGVAPVRAFLNSGVNVGLGTDVAGGHSLSIMRVMAEAVQASKLRWRLLDQSMKALTVPEVFYMATRGGGSFFGKVGAFDEGYEFDALVLDDSHLPTPLELTPEQRLERLVYLAGDECVAEKFVAGERVYSR